MTLVISDPVYVPACFYCPFQIMCWMEQESPPSVMVNNSLHLDGDRQNICFQGKSMYLDFQVAILD